MCMVERKVSPKNLRRKNLFSKAAYNFFIQSHPTPPSTSLAFLNQLSIISSLMVNLHYSFFSIYEDCWESCYCCLVLLLLDNFPTSTLRGGKYMPSSGCHYVSEDSPLEMGSWINCPRPSHSGLRRTWKWNLILVPWWSDCTVNMICLHISV